MVIFFQSCCGATGQYRSISQNIPIDIIFEDNDSRFLADCIITRLIDDSNATVESEEKRAFWDHKKKIIKEIIDEYIRCSRDYYERHC